MRKRIALLFVAMVMVFALAGCGKSDDNRKEDTEAVGNNNASIELRGEVKDGAYCNDYFGISFSVEDDIMVFSDEMILSTLGITADFLDEKGKYTPEEFEKLYKGMIIDYMHMYADKKSNVNIIFSKMTEEQWESVNLDQYAELSKEQIAQTGVANYTFEPIEKRVYGGIEYACIDSKTDIGMEQHAFICLRNGYSITITMTDFSNGEYYKKFAASFLDVK